MRDYVMDANVLMSILISGRSDYRPLLTYYNFLLPEFVLVEIEKYSHIIKKKSRRNEQEFLLWTYFVFSQLTILPQYLFSDVSLSKARQLTEKIDIKDTNYVALAMELDLILLTRDKQLHQGLRKKGFRKVLMFEDFLRAI